MVFFSTKCHRVAVSKFSDSLPLYKMGYGFGRGSVEIVYLPCLLGMVTRPKRRENLAHCFLSFCSLYLIIKGHLSQQRGR